MLVSERRKKEKKRRRRRSHTTLPNHKCWHPRMVTIESSCQNLARTYSLARTSEFTQRHRKLVSKKKISFLKFCFCRELTLSYNLHILINPCKLKLVQKCDRLLKCCTVYHNKSLWGSRQAYLIWEIIAKVTFISRMCCPTSAPGRLLGVSLIGSGS